jgi:quercetin dioxygenase-like cupin family protein
MPAEIKSDDVAREEQSFREGDAAKQNGCPPELSNLDVLRELTARLPSLNDLLGRGGTYTNYAVEGGSEAECVGMSILNNGSVAVQDSFMTKGTIFPHHTQEEIEHLIVYKGRLLVHVAGVPDIVLEAGGHVRFNPNVSHGVEALEKTWLIAITVPAGKGYPK